MAIAGTRNHKWEKRAYGARCRNCDITRQDRKDGTTFVNKRGVASPTRPECEKTIPPAKVAKATKARDRRIDKAKDADATLRSVRRDMKARGKDVSAGKISKSVAKLEKKTKGSPVAKKTPIVPQKIAKAPKPAAPVKITPIPKPRPSRAKKAPIVAETSVLVDDAPAGDVTE